MTTTFRRGSSRDLEAILELRRDCYPAQLDMALLRRRFAENPRFRLDDDLVVAEQDGRIVANALAIPCRCYVGANLLQMCGLASVAVHPLQRRQGIAGQLIGHALDLGRQRGDVISGLFAFEYGFYQRQGWGTVSRAERYRVDPRHLPDGRRNPALRSLHQRDWDLVSLCYHQAESQAGRLALHRGPGVWSELLSSPAIRAIGAARGDRLDGYLLFEYQACRDQPLTSEVMVHELVAIDDQAYRDLLGFLNRLQEQVAHIVFPASVEDPFPLLWKEQKQINSEMVLGEHYSLGDTCVGMMLRWLDPVQALAGRAYPALDCQLQLRVSDPLQSTPEDLTFQLHRGQPRVENCRLETVDLSSDVATWTQIWAGAVTPRQAARWGRLEGRRGCVELAEQIFATPASPFVHGLDCF